MEHTHVCSRQKLSVESRHAFAQCVVKQGMPGFIKIAFVWEVSVHVCVHACMHLYMCVCVSVCVYMCVVIPEGIIN